LRRCKTDLTLNFNSYKQPNTTSNNGCLGSRIDEDRSELRYVMRTAVLVNHQIVERILRFPLSGSIFLWVCLNLSRSKRAVYGSCIFSFAKTRMASRECKFICNANERALIASTTSKNSFFPFLRRVEMVLLGTFQTVRKIKKLARLGSPPDLILKKKKSNAENE